MALQIFSQRDPRWANQNLGTSNVTIGGYGCIITCLAMAFTYFGIETNPAIIDNNLTDYGGYSDGNMYNFNAIEKISNLKESGSMYSNYSESDYSAILGFIKEAVANPNKICIIQIDMVPDTIEANSHYVIVNKVIDDSNIEIIDPWTGTIRNLSDYYGDTVSKPADTICQAFSIEDIRSQELLNSNNTQDGTIVIPQYLIDKAKETYPNGQNAQIFNYYIGNLQLLKNTGNPQILGDIMDRDNEIDDLKIKNSILESKITTNIDEINRLDNEFKNQINTAQVMPRIIVSEQSLKEVPNTPRIENIEVKNPEKFNLDKIMVGYSQIGIPQSILTACVGILIWVGTKFGFNLDDQTANSILNLFIIPAGVQFLTHVIKFLKK